MKPLGFSLAEMAELLRVIDSGEADAGDVPATEEVLDSFIAQAQERREALRVQQCEVSLYLAQSQQDGTR